MELDTSQRKRVAELIGLLSALLADGADPVGTLISASNELLELKEEVAQASLKSRREKLVALYASPDFEKRARTGANLTVVEWLILKDPETLDFMQDPARETVADGRAISKLARSLGHKPLKVEAPEDFKDAGIETLNAYPVHLLDQYYDDHS